MPLVMEQQEWVKNGVWHLTQGSDSGSGLGCWERWDLGSLTVGTHASPQEGVGLWEATGPCSGGGKSLSEVPVELLELVQGLQNFKEAKYYRFSGS